MGIRWPIDDDRPIVKTILKSTKLNNVCYDIRGPVLDLAQQME
jgi:alanine-synthesizing transaminase